MERISATEATAPSPVKVSELNRLFARLPRLDEAEAEAFERDLDAIRRAQTI